jgi:hypothetical protein
MHVIGFQAKAVSPGAYHSRSISTSPLPKTCQPVRNMVHVVLYGADKAVIVYIVHSELYRIIILNNNYDYYSIDITASALYS